jgi:hypothetical protein
MVTKCTATKLIKDENPNDQCNEVFVAAKYYLANQQASSRNQD